MTPSLAQLEETAAANASRPLEELYRETGLPAGPVRILARLAGRDWPPRLLLALEARRQGRPGPLPGSPEAQALLRSLGVPLLDRHLSESPLRTG